jgi:ABC-type glycerol-3-phosphate transport system permease component
MADAALPRVAAAPRYNPRRMWAMVATYGVLFFAICVILFPIFWMFSSSFKGQTELFARDMTLLPRVWSWENYVNVWSNTPFPKYFWNSFYIAVITTLITVAFAIYAAYAIARLRFRGRFLIGMILLVTQMFPHVTLVLPLFLIIRNIGLFDTHAALIIAQVAFSLPFAVWMLRGFFVSIPAELEDAAAVDGAGLMTTLHKIIVPLAGPGIAAVAMFTFIRSWNEFLFALVLLQSQSLRTLPLGLASFQEEYTYRWDLMMAGGSIISLPVLFFFILMQRFIVQGLLGGALKG